MVNIQKGRRMCFSILNDTLQLCSLTIAHNEESVVRARLQLLSEFRFLLGRDQRIREHGVACGGNGVRMLRVRELCRALTFPSYCMRHW